MARCKESPTPPEGARLIDAQTYLEHVRRDGERIASVAEGNLDIPVPSCPGLDVASLLLHTAMFCSGRAQLVEGRWSEPRTPDHTGFGDDVLAAHRREHARLVEALRSTDPTEPMWSWGSDQHARFWLRRAAQELSIHRWDFEDAVGEPLPIDPTLASDGVDEFVEEFTPNPPAEWGMDGVAKRFGGDGERLRFETTDVTGGWTLTMRPDQVDASREGDADVVARGTASDVNLFLWGRVPPSALEVGGDASLLERWQERVKI